MCRHKLQADEHLFSVRAITDYGASSAEPFRADVRDVVKRFRQTGEKPVSFFWALSVQVIRL